MDWITINVQIGLAAIAVLLAVWLIRRLARGRAASPFAAKSGLLTPDERAFLERLEQAAGADYRVYPRVRLADVVGIRDMRNQRARQRALDRIADRCADFVLCTPEQLVIVAVIAYRADADDGEDRQLRHVCRACNLPLVQFAGRDPGSVASIRRRLLEALGSPNAPELGPLDAPPEDGDRRTPSLPPLSESRDVPTHADERIHRYPH